MRRAVIDGDVMSGFNGRQSVGMVKEEKPVAEIIAKLVEEAVDALVASNEPLITMTALC